MKGSVELSAGRTPNAEQLDLRLGRDLAETIWRYPGEAQLVLDVPVHAGAAEARFQEGWLSVAVPRAIGLELANWLYALYDVAGEWPRKKVGDCAFSLACATGLFDAEAGEWRDAV